MMKNKSSKINGKRDCMKMEGHTFQCHSQNFLIFSKSGRWAWGEGIPINGYDVNIFREKGSKDKSDKPNVHLRYAELGIWSSRKTIL